MCGISGFFKINKDLAYIDRVFIKKMNDTMISRGPDGEGIWIEPTNCCGLGHRRLSILDLSNTAAQPMASSDGTICVSYNGEIYNHREIRKELLSLGVYDWKTDHSDTEVLLKSYERWGIKCIDKFRGMFAFALWDGKSKEFYLVRDRIGIKPLYYSIEEGLLLFASEIKAILSVSDKSPQVDERALYDYLTFLTTPCDQTLFKGIKKLRPATYMKVSQAGGISIHEYWDLWDHTHPELYQASDDEIRECLLDELRTSVKLRKKSDVPVGVFLSGGIDSSTNAALFSEGDESSVKTFCIGYAGNHDSYSNENRYARLMADYCHAEFYEKYLSEDDLLGFVQKMVISQDEPIADPVCVPVYYVSKLAKDNGVTVAQVGEGSDELFWGYKSWKTYLQLSRWDRRTPAFIERVGLNLLNSIGKGYEMYTEFLRRGYEGTPIFWTGAEAFFEYDKKRMLSNDVLKIVGKDYTSFEAINPTYKKFRQNAWEQSFLNWMSYSDLRHRIPELLLMRVDKMSMAVSLECRVPFLDHVFVEKAMSVAQKVFPDLTVQSAISVVQDFKAYP